MKSIKMFVKQRNNILWYLHNAQCLQTFGDCFLFLRETSIFTFMSFYWHLVFLHPMELIDFKIFRFKVLDKRKIKRWTISCFVPIFGLSLDYIWTIFGVALGQLWDSYGIVFWIALDSSGIALEQPWDSYGIYASISTLYLL